MSTVVNMTAATGCGTAWGGRLFCKLEMAGSIPVWSIEKTKEIKEMKRKRKVRKQKKDLRL